MAAEGAIVGARIRTMDPDRPWAEAVAWSGGRIMSVGTADEVRDACDRTTEVIDARGAALTPGIIDGHQHLFMGAEIGRGLDLDRVDSLAELRARLAAERAAKGPGEWIVGYALEYAAFEGATYHHDLIDAAAGDGPMLLWALDLHTAFANAAALRACGVTEEVIFPDGSRVVVDDDGDPTGLLLEMPAIQLVFDRIPGAEPEDRIAWYVDAMRRQNAVGITSIHLMDGNLESVDLLDRLDRQGLLSLFVKHHHFVWATTSSDEVTEMLTAFGRRGPSWSADGVKFMMDGVVETGTAWLDEPDTTGHVATPMWERFDDYLGTIRRFHDAGYRIATHAIGDRAVRTVLDAYAALPGGSQGRHRIEHIEVAPDATVRRFRAESVNASMQPIHLRWMAPDLSDPWSQRLGPARCAHGMRSGDLQVDGANLVLGSDWPVAPFDPRLGFFAGQERHAHDIDFAGGHYGASATLTGEQVLAGYTVNAARAAGMSDQVGKLRPGLRADIVMWAEDPVMCPTADVIDLPVLLTVASGRIVHRAA